MGVGDSIRATTSPGKREAALRAIGYAREKADRAVEAEERGGYVVAKHHIDQVFNKELG